VEAPEKEAKRTMHAHDSGFITWRKSSRSNGSGGNNCVEVAGLGVVAAIRDSKDPDGPVLLLTRPQWQGFTTSVKRGELDRPS
jgi:Domain of unknown function (DUF397)